MPLHPAITHCHRVNTRAARVLQQIEQIQLSLGHASIQTTERYPVRETDHTELGADLPATGGEAESGRDETAEPLTNRISPSRIHNLLLAFRARLPYSGRPRDFRHGRGGGRRSESALRAGGKLLSSRKKGDSSGLPGVVAVTSRLCQMPLNARSSYRPI
jgi:hypothetical protein